MKARSDLRHDREARLLKLLELRAPSSVIDAECRLLLSTDHSGHLGAIVWSASVLVRDKWNWYRDGVQLHAHNLARKCGMHWQYPDEWDSDVPCWVCEALEWAAEMEDAEASNA